MDLNFKYILKEAAKKDSELVNFILNYDGVLPICLYYTFNENVNPADFPLSTCKEIQAKHGENWKLHQKFNKFAKKGESFEDCDNRLIKELLQSTKLPIFK